jgi:hypothetical protein
MGVLTVQIDKRYTLLSQIADRRQPTIYIGARSSIKWNNPGQNHLNVFVNKPTLYTCLARTRSNDARICPTTNEQTYCLNQHRFAGACLASQRSEATSQNDFKFFDYA